MSRLSPADRGFALGDGLFETVLARGGELVAWERHMARLARGCAALGLPEPEADDCRDAALAALEATGLVRDRAAVRIVWTAGEGGRGLDRPAAVDPRLIATASAAVKPKGPASLATVATRRNEGSPASRLKSLAYLDNVLARREAEAAGADEALMLNNRGELASAAAANLFWREGGVLFTPALDAGVLDGTVRGVLIERARAAGWAVQEVRVQRQALDRAEAVYLTNSLVGLRPVDSLDGRRLRADPRLKAFAGLVADLA